MLNLINEDEDLFNQANTNNDIPANPFEINNDTIAPTETLPTQAEDIQVINTPVDTTGWQRLIAPDGEAYWSPAGRVDEALKGGFRFENPDAEVPVYTPQGKSTFIKAGDLTDALGRGFAYKGFEQEIQDTYSKNPELIKEALQDANNLGIKAGTFLSALGRGATFGLSDVIASTIMTEGNKADLRIARDLNKEITLAGDIIGAMVGSGAISTLKATNLLTNSLASMGMSAKAAQASGVVLRNTLEGAAFGLGYTASEDAMGNPEITAESYLFNAGVGAMLGGALSGLAEGIGHGVRAVKSARVARMPVVDLPPATLTQHLEPSPSNGFRSTFEIANETGDRFGGVSLTVSNPNATSPIGRTGAVVEDIIFTPGAPKGIEKTTFNNLLDEYGSVISKNIEDLSPEVEAVFRELGTEIIDQQGKRFYIVFEKSITEEQAVKATKDKIFDLLKTLGRDAKPEDQALFNKFRDNSTFHNKVIDYASNPEKVIQEGVDHISAINKIKKDTHKVTNQWRSMVTESLDDITALPVIKKTIDDDIFPALIALEEKMAQNIDQFVNPSSIRGVLNDFSSSISDIYSNTTISAAQRFEKLHTLTRKAYELQSKNVGAVYGSTVNMLDDVRNALRQAETKIFQGVDSTGQLANNYDAIQEASSRVIKASTNFNKAFGVDKGGLIDPAKVYNQLKSTNVANKLKSGYAEMEMAAAINNMDSLLKRVAKGTPLEVPPIDRATVSKPLIASMQEAREMVGILEGIATKPNSWVEDTFRTSSMGLGGGLPMFAAQATGQSWLGGLWYMGSQGMGQFARAKMAAGRAPLEAFKQVAERASAGNATRVSAVDKVIGSLKRRTGQVAEAISPVVNKTSLATAASALGIVASTNKEETINKMIERIQRDITPGSVSDMTERLGMVAPDTAKQLIAKIENLQKYALEELPAQKTGKGYDKYTRDEVRKVVSVVDVLFNPEQAFNNAIATGDVGTLQQIEKFYPNIIKEFKDNLVGNIGDTPLDNLKASSKHLVSWASNNTLQARDTKMANSVRNTYKELAGEEQEGAGRPQSFKPLTSQKAMSRSDQLTER